MVVEVALILKLWPLCDAGPLPVASKACRTLITSCYGKESPIVKLK